MADPEAPPAPETTEEPTAPPAEEQAPAAEEPAPAPEAPPAAPAEAPPAAEAPASEPEKIPPPPDGIPASQGMAEYNSMSKMTRYTISKVKMNTGYLKLIQCYYVMHNEHTCQKSIYGIKLVQFDTWIPG